MSADDMRAKMLARFGEIGLERLTTLDNGVMTLEKNPGDTDTAELVMREIHTVKGESKMLALLELNAIAHTTEDVLLLAQQSGFTPPPGTWDVVLEGLDLMREVINEGMVDLSEELADKGAVFMDNANNVVAAAAEAAEAGEGAAPPAEAAPTPAPAQVEPEEDSVERVEANEMASFTATPASAETATAAQTKAKKSAKTVASSLRVPVSTLDGLTYLSGDLVLRQAHIDKLTADINRVLTDMSETVETSRRQAAAANQSSEWNEQVTNMKTLKAYIREMLSHLNSLKDDSFMNKVKLDELQDDISSMRLLKMDELFQRYPRAIRDLAKEQGKNIDVHIIGGSVAADKSVLDALGDPMLHLIRNSVDHGIESPEDRRAAGKAELATVVLAARRVGDTLVITLRDDGRGIDPDKVRQAMVRKGVMTITEANALSEEMVYEQLFRSGFSTRKVATDISGRGVGLDVVKKTVEQLGGNISVQSEIGRGTTFSLSVPISVAIASALVVKLNEGLFAFPSHSVHTAIITSADAIQETGESRAIDLGDGLKIPYVRLSDVLGFPSPPLEKTTDIPVIVAQNANRLVAFEVPFIVGERSVVQHKPPAFLSNLHVISGTSMLEGGKLLTFLSVGRLFEMATDVRGGVHFAAKKQAKVENTRKTVLIVEDSDLTREMIASTVAKLGFNVIEAVNGRDGMKKFSKAAVDLIMTDLDMPILGGIGLIKEVRAGRFNNSVPIVVLSTRSTKESREEAAAAGADAYLTKSAFSAADLSSTLGVLVGV